MYNVRIEHFKQHTRNGDLEATLKLVDIKSFKTKKLAKDYVESQLLKYKIVKRHYPKGGKSSYCFAFTGKTWIHENTGEKCEEFSRYSIFKTICLK